ncbi:MAG: thioredoxin family protein [Candidatus Methanofastidiosia archaeon]
MIKILYFYADWCQDCEIQSSVLEELALEYDDVIFELVNVDYQANKARKYEVINIPMLILEEDEEIITKIEGVIEIEDLEDIIDSLHGELYEEEDYDEFI